MSCLTRTLLLAVLLLGLSLASPGGRIEAGAGGPASGGAEGESIPPVTASGGGPLRLMPSSGAISESASRPQGASSWDYDPTSVYDQKGLTVPRGFTAQAPAELVDPFSGNLVLRHTDLYLPGVAGLDLSLQRVYNSKIHRNYAAKASGDPNRAARGMLFVPPSPLGLGWSLHLGRIIEPVGAAPALSNDQLTGPRYYERSDGSQVPIFTFSGPGCGNETTDICLITRRGDNPARLFDGENFGPWRIATADGLNITFGHTAPDVDPFVQSAVHYATEIRDIHGNRIQIFYHDNTIPGISVQREYFRHYIDYIIDSAGRRIEFSYVLVESPDIVRLSSIEANGSFYRYFYTSDTPHGQAFLREARPPEGASWRYEYRGLASGDCASADRWCELTRITYPSGGTIEYTFEDLVFYTHGNPASVRAVTRRVEGGRDVTATTWRYEYNRGANYSGDDHTVIVRPDGSREAYTYFGTAEADYNPLGLAWQAGALLQKQVRASGGGALQTETFQWEPSPPVSGETWGDPWTGFDTGVRVPRLAQHVIQRGSLTWTTEHTSFNERNHAPRCTTEEGDGQTSYRLRFYQGVSDVQGELFFRFLNLLAVDGLSYSPFTSTQCNSQQSISWTPDTGDEVDDRLYNAEGQVAVRQTNGVRTDHQYHADGSLKAEIIYQDEDRASTFGFCTVYADYQRGVARQITYGATSPPTCGGGVYSVQRTVDWFGRVESETNGRGKTTAFQYDSLGRVRRIVPPPGSGEADIQIIYDGSPPASPNTSRRVEQGVFWTETRYDGFGRELERETSGGVHLRQEYDALGRIRFQSLPSNSPDPTAGDTFAYDALGRVQAVTRADGSTVGYAYGASAHTVSITDEEDRATVYTRRAFANPDDFLLARVQLPGEPAPASDTYTYLVGGHLTGVNYGGRQRTIEYNFAKLVQREHNPESGDVFYGYYDDGSLGCRDRRSLASCLNPPVAEVFYQVDGLGRVTRIDYLSGPDVTFAYDNADNLETMYDGAGAHTFSYTDTNRLEHRTSVVDGVTYITEYSYDNRGDVEQVTYPSGRVITYDYDAGNRITTVRDGSNNFATGIEYHPSGVARRLTYGNGVTTTLSLDARQRPDVLSAPGVVGLDYGYDDVGNVTSLMDSVSPNSSMSSLGYDGRDRLEDASGPWGTLHYDYNAAGDRTREVLDGQATVYSYDSQGRLDFLSGRVSLDFGYDDYGLVVRRGNPGQRDFSYAYDSENRITSVNESDASGARTVVTYRYDGQGQRMRATRDGCHNDLVYHYDQQGNRIAESAADGLMLKEYITLNQRTIAELDVRPLRVSPDQGVIDFGDVNAGASETRNIALTNRTDAPITVELPFLFFPFSYESSSQPITIPARETTVVTVVFQPIQRGQSEQSLTECQSNVLELDLILRGRGVAAVAEITPPEFDLGEVPFGEVVTRDFTVANTGDIDLLVAGWQLSDPAISVTPSGPATVQPGESYEPTLSFDSATACSGEYQGELVLNSNSLFSVQLEVRADVLALELDLPGELEFGPVDQGMAHTETITLTNRAAVPLTPMVSLDGAPQFRLGTAPTGTLAPGDQASFEVTYEPGEEPWSPFGDHAMLWVEFEGCAAKWPQRIHLIGNVHAEPVPQAGDNPALAIVTDTLHVATKDRQAPEIKYAVRDATGQWSQGPTPLDGSGDPKQPALLGEPGGRLTVLWHEGTSFFNTQIKLRQRSSSDEWGATCVLSAGRSGWDPLALESGGDIWLAWFDRTTFRLRAGPVLSAAGECLSGQSPPIVSNDPFFTSASSLEAHPADGRFYLASGPGDAIRVATLDPASGAVSVARPTLNSDVNFTGSAALMANSDGGLHLVWPEIKVGIDYDPEARYIYRDPAGSWGQPLALIEDCPEAGDVRVVVDSGSAIHVAWTAACSGIEGRRLYYATRPVAASDWVVTEVSTPGYSGFGMSLALDAQADRLAAVWQALPSAGGEMQLLTGTLGFPSIVPGTDTDSDGIPDDVEDGAPNGGDGNSDGTPDRQQAHVASLPNAANGDYITLASAEGTTLVDVAAVANPSPEDAPAGVTFPVGFLEFTVQGIAAGGPTAVTLIPPLGTRIETYYKFGPTPDDPAPHWYEFSFDGTTGAEVLTDRVILHFVDGQRGDHDLLENGQVVEPGAPAATLVCGDQNQDGQVDVSDVVIDLQIAVGLIEANADQQRLSDLNRDGAINVFDAIIGLRHIVGQVEVAECGPPDSQG